MKVILFALIILLWGCSEMDRIKPEGFDVTILSDTITFAAIGDFGDSGLPEYSVAEMVKSWNPDFILTLGDNNYTEGKLSTIKSNITDFYGDFIYNYDAPGNYQCQGKAFDEKINRFFSTPGNHDANNSDGLIPYYNFFTLPGNESYYQFQWGPITFYSLNSASENFETEENWLKSQVVKSNTPFKIVFFHHPPYSEGGHGNNSFMQWKFQEMGIDLVLSGHDHIYNRIEKKDEPNLIYIVNGLGGRERNKAISKPLDPSLFESFYYSSDYGALLLTANRHKLHIRFEDIGDFQIIDSVSIVK